MLTAPWEPVVVDGWRKDEGAGTAGCFHCPRLRVCVCVYLCMCVCVLVEQGQLGAAAGPDIWLFSTAPAVSSLQKPNKATHPVWKLVSTRQLWLGRFICDTQMLRKHTHYTKYALFYHWNNNGIYASLASHQLTNPKSVAVLTHKAGMHCTTLLEMSSISRSGNS